MPLNNECRGHFQLPARSRTAQTSKQETDDYHSVDAKAGTQRYEHGAPQAASERGEISIITRQIVANINPKRAT
ncbi:hypothetical protein HDE68_003494 [Pedobacter cryoconitis]|uniref:Uncharacterized protein n=1 Tax=Pedobacter cryoconitis TaxID=188932 RepID=A0A7W8ZP43_9SPHI|nr:hypothetical protein [Pedobacter cryoconitis]